MFNRIRANMTLAPLINILNESGSKDSSMFENRHINGYLGYKFRSRSIGLPVEGVYEVTVTKDPFGYNIVAELGYGDALYILCIPTDCKGIIGRFSIPELDIDKDGEVKGKDANRFIQIFKIMYDRRDKSSQGYMNCKYNASDIRRYHLQEMLSCKDIVIKDQKKRENTTVKPKLNKISFEMQNRTGREKEMIVFSTKENARKQRRIEIDIEEIVRISNKISKYYNTDLFEIETYEARIFDDIEASNEISRPTETTNDKRRISRPIETTNDKKRISRRSAAAANYQRRISKSSEVTVSNGVEESKIVGGYRIKYKIYNEENIKRDLLKMLECQMFIIKDRNKNTNINIDKRLNEISFEKSNEKGKMELIIIRKANTNKRRIRIYLEDIIELTKKNSKFTIEAYEVTVTNF